MMISAPPGALPDAHALFRKQFTLAEAPERAPARVTADSRYLLYCNGQEVYRGPIRSQPRRMVYDLFDLAPYLKAGENILAIYVKYYGSANAFWMPAPGGFGAIHGPQLVFEANLGQAWLVTDATWKAHKSTAWAEDWRGGKKLSILHDIVPLEVFDARQFPAGWERPGFDDSAWGNAFVISGASFTGPIPPQPPTTPYGPLHPRPIARLSRERRDPVSVALQMLRGRVDLAFVEPDDAVLKRCNVVFFATSPYRNVPPLLVCFFFRISMRRISWFASRCRGLTRTASRKYFSARSISPSTREITPSW